LVWNQKVTVTGNVNNHQMNGGAIVVQPVHDNATGDYLYVAIAPSTTGTYLRIATREAAAFQWLLNELVSGSPDPGLFTLTIINDRVNIDVTWDWDGTNGTSPGNYNRSFPCPDFWKSFSGDLNHYFSLWQGGSGDTSLNMVDNIRIEALP